MINTTESLNKFGFEVLQKLNSKSNNNSNAVFSPFSAFVCVSMTTSLFKYQTRDEIYKSLQIPCDSSLQIDNFLKQLKEFLNKEDSESISSSNRVWVNEKLKFNPETFLPNSKILGVPIEKVSFPQPGCDRINDEVNRATKGMIQKLLDASLLSASSAIVLTNAVYFQSRWDEIFVIDPESKRPDAKNFTLLDGKQIHVNMLQSFERQLLFSEDSQFQIVAIPYLRHKYDMLIILPKDKTINGFNNLSKLTYKKLDDMIKALKIRYINLKMPKFEIESSIQLNEMFQSLGMKKAFTDAADCTDPNVKYLISLILQKAKIMVDENGTIASAATAVMMDECACEIEGEPINIFIDHPFAYILRNKKTKTFIFEGFVKNPSA